MIYPSRHFPGTPRKVRRAVRSACDVVGAGREKWAVPLEAIARYESDCNPYISDAGDLRGMMQQSVGQYEDAHRVRRDLVPKVNYASARQAVIVAILYIRSELIRYGGYEGIGAVYGDKGLLSRTDRGPGNVLRYWLEHQHAGFAGMRSLYRGY